MMTNAQRKALEVASQENEGVAAAGVFHTRMGGVTRINAGAVKALSAKGYVRILPTVDCGTFFEITSEGRSALAALP